MKTNQAILSGLIYQFKRGKAGAFAEPDDDGKKYLFLSPAADWTPTTILGDVWVCDGQGRVHPGYNVSPVPVPRTAIGALVGRFQS